MKVRELAWVRPGVTAAVLGLSLLACEQKKAPVAEAERQGPSTKGAEVDATPPALGRVDEKPDALKSPWRLLGEVPHEAAGPLKSAPYDKGVIVCRGCEYPGTPTLHVVTREGVQPWSGPDLLTTLDAQYGKQFANLKGRFPYGATLELIPSAATELRVRLSASYDDDNIERNGADYHSAVFALREGRWGRIPDVTAPASNGVQAPPTELPREFDDALSQLPFYATGYLAGGGGPLVAFDRKNYGVFDGKSWQTYPAVFGQLPGALRLSDGSSLISGTGNYRLDQQGRAEALQLLPGKTVHSSKWMLVVGEPWLELTAEDATHYLAPQQAVHVVELPQREPINNSTPRAHAGSAEDATAHAQDTVQQGPAPLKDDCATPFILLSTPPQPHWNYGASAKALQGLDGTGLRFYEFVRGGTTYFGAQADSLSSAERLQKHFESAIKGSRPQRYCWDVAGYLQDPYAPYPDLRLVRFNFVLGSEFKFLQ